MSILLNSVYSLTMAIKKEGWGGGGVRTISFQRGDGDLAVLKPGGKGCVISIGDGLPSNTRKCSKVWGGLL